MSVQFGTKSGGKKSPVVCMVHIPVCISLLSVGYLLQHESDCLRVPAAPVEGAHVVEEQPAAQQEEEGGGAAPGVARAHTLRHRAIKQNF